MRPAMHHLSISAVRADALFVSALQRSEEPSTGQVRQAVAAAVRAFGGRGCAERVAQEFGEHPDTAAARMRWARRMADEAFGALQPAAEPWLRHQSRPGSPEPAGVTRAGRGHQSRPGGGCGQAPPERRRAIKR